jgi:alanine racemase
MDRLPTWVEIHLNRLETNLRRIRERLPRGTRVLLTVKADAYGHGAVPVARAASPWVDALGVATVDEAVELVRAGVDREVLVMSPILESEIGRALEQGLALTVSDGAFAEALARKARDSGRSVRVHLEVDTGMGRAGVNLEEAESLAERLSRLEGIEFAGLFTHFPSADSDREFTREQLERFLALKERLVERGIACPPIHAANSSALTLMPETHLDMVRPGLMAYGYLPEPTLPDPGLRPVLEWKSRLALVRWIPEGWSVSYQRTFVTRRRTRLGVVPVGYGHGYPFSLSNRASVLVRGVPVPVIGRVTMDMTMIDLTDHPDELEPGEEVVLLGRQGEAELRLHDLARWAGTIPYEILCGISKRVPRLYLRDGAVEGMRSLLGAASKGLLF